MSHEMVPSQPATKFPVTTAEIRDTFINFFQENDHQIHPEAGVLPKNDPTLLFINSGMAPMKPYFTAEATPPAPMLTNTQTCIRTTDFEDVGDSHHGTSFRMMGSWSIGAYGREKAIELAHELITERFGLPESVLYATVLDNDGPTAVPGAQTDNPSLDHWKRYLPADRIVASPPEDNFWGPAGTSGPCGPCTEVFYDRGPGYEDKDDTSETLRSGRHVEIWNAGVFMELYKDEAGSMSPLPLKSVDSGAGLERFAMILQNAPSIHQIDQYQEAYAAAEQIAPDTRGARIVFDHTKTALTLLESGIVPGNKQEAYILRRLLRRSIGVAEMNGKGISDLMSVRQALRASMDPTPERTTSDELVDQVIAYEAELFAKVMKRAQVPLAKVAGRGTITGQEAYSLKSTHGIPEDYIVEFCRSNGIVFPEDDFKLAAANHSASSK